MKGCVRRPNSVNTKEPEKGETLSTGEQQKKWELGTWVEQVRKAGAVAQGVTAAADGVSLHHGAWVDHGCFSCPVVKDSSLWVARFPR